MLSELQRRIAVAVLADVTLDAIEATIIDPAPLDEEQESALWGFGEDRSRIERFDNAPSSFGLFG